MSSCNWDMLGVYQDYAHSRQRIGLGVECYVGKLGNGFQWTFEYGAFDVEL